MKDNFKDERIMILEMVREGKVSADEATQLLNALCENRPSYSHFDSEDLEDKFNKFYQTVDCFAKDLKVKLEGAYKKAEPKVKTATKKVMEKTAVVMEDLSKSINEGAKKVHEYTEEVELESIVDIEEKDEENI